MRPILIADGWNGMMNRPTVFVCEVEPAALAGVRWFLSESGEFAFVGGAATIPEAVPELEATRPDLLLIDHSSGVRSTIQFLSELADISHSTKCLLWTRDIPEAELVRAFRTGAKGAVRKSSPLSVLLEAMRRVLAGDTFLEESASSTLRQWSSNRDLPRLTPREREIIELVSLGMKNREIADRLAITAGTVKVHLMHVFEKTGSRDRYELAVRGARILGETEARLDIRRSA